MPYGYYMFVRFISTFTFALLAFKEFEKNNTKLVLFIALAVLFQPLFKIPLGRTIWNLTDVLVSLYLIYSIYGDYKEHQSENEKFKKEK